MGFNSVIRHIIVAAAIGMTLVCLFTPDILFFKQIEGYTLYVMLGLLGLGMVSFVYNQPRIMMVSLVCCIALNLYLKDSSNDKLRLATATTDPSLRISHISLGNAESDYDEVIKYLLNIETDFLSFQELTPDWNSHLISGLASKYNYIQTLTRLDQYGMGFFSKIPFQDLDTIYVKNIPNLAGTIRMDGKRDCHIINCQVVPPVNQSAFQVIEQQFDTLSMYMSMLQGEKVVLGDFHLPPWSSEVQKFREDGHLKDGRRDIHPRNVDGSMSLPRIPVEHILFSDAMECTSFAEIGNAQIGRIGITGTYQLQQENESVAQ